MTKRKTTPKPAAEQWNPRYVQYARVHRRTPEEQRAADLTTHSGCLGFVMWHTDRIEEAACAVPMAFTFASLTDGPTYDAWLVARVDELIKGEAP